MPRLLQETIRRPQRTRGFLRFEHLLDSAELLLAKQPDIDISLPMIAVTANVPLPSIYHFFTNKDAIFVALAQRYHVRLAAMALEALDPPPETWQDIVRRRQQCGVSFLNKHPSALRLFMGAGVSAEVRTLDLQGNASLARLRAQEFQHWFDCAGIANLEKHLAVSIGLMDGIWAISWSQHRRITDEFLNESIRASVAYLRCYLPEILQLRVGLRR
jgi:AcrR family transcriptional regulator